MSPPVQASGTASPTILAHHIGRAFCYFCGNVKRWTIPTLPEFVLLMNLPQVRVSRPGRPRSKGTPSVIPDPYEPIERSPRKDARPRIASMGMVRSAARAASAAISLASPPPANMACHRRQGHPARSSVLLPSGPRALNRIDRLIRSRNEIGTCRLLPEAALPSSMKEGCRPAARMRRRLSSPASCRSPSAFRAAPYIRKAGQRREHGPQKPPLHVQTP